MPRKTIQFLILCATFLAAAPLSADAQPTNRWQDYRRAGRRQSAYLKNNEQIQNLLKPVVAPAAAATVRVSCDGHSVALGTVVSADGLIVTKASQLAEKPECRLADGRTLPATVVGTDEATDIALLRVDAKNLTPVTWADPPTPGSMIAAPMTGRDSLLFGVVSDVPQPMPGPSRNIRPHGWLGITVAPIDEGAEISEISRGSAAEKAGLKNGDLIKRLDGESVHTSDQLIERLSRMPPNKKVSLSVSRKDKDKGKEMEVNVTLGRSPGTLPHDHWGGGPFSDRRWGFNKVIPNDLGISPTDCGGPVVDIDGHCVGVNIARALRVATYALPASVVQETVGRLKATVAQK
jgi:serine protease Do